jgi:S-adenosylmethionine:tRNA ribosyltransferase-isomerase
VAKDDAARDLFREPLKHAQQGSQLRTDLFDYELPQAAIAERPLADRAGARLLVLDALSGTRHDFVRDWPKLVPAGALVVINDTRVRHCRVVGARPSGGRVELLLVRRIDASGGSETWECLGRASKPLRVGDVVECTPLRVVVLQKHGDGTLACGISSAVGSVESAVAEIGHVPIPPYLRRDDDAVDRERYQTVFARETGSAAAPTAGLHLTEAALGELKSRGVAVASVTLHVGLGTFKAVSAPDLDQHAMHAEAYFVPEATARAIAEARQRGGPVVAVGTTVVRALESAAASDTPGGVRSGREETRLLIQPGYRFRVVDALFTNFHAPQSTLLALVSAFAGRERVLSAYREALASGYRFLSYGDAMWIPRRAS